jgi:RNAse (barnase) inhibitor barstar
MTRAAFTVGDMRASDLRKVGGPPIVPYRASESHTYELAWRLAADGLAARVLRGTKMRTDQALFDEVSAALQFPDYFGENWAALEECLTDLTWLPAKGYVLFIVWSELVLVDELDDSLALLRRIILRVSERWATPIVAGESGDRPAIPFHVVLQFPATGVELAMAR